MRSKEIKELHNKTLIELKTLLRELKLDLGKLKLDLALKKQKNLHALLLKRKDISRIMTIIKEKELTKEIT